MKIIHILLWVCLISFTPIRAFQNNPDTVLIKKLLEDSVQFLQSDQDSANQIYRKVISLSRAAEFPMGVHRALIGIAQLQLYSGQIDSAIYYNERAIEIAQEIDFQQGVNRCRFNIALSHQVAENRTEALDNYLKVLDYFEENRDTITLIHIYQNMGVLYQEITQYDKALELSDKSLVLSRASRDTFKIASLLMNKGTILMKTDSTNLSLRYFEEAKGLENKIPDMEFKTMINVNLSEYYYKTGEFESALSYIEQALSNLEKFKTLRSELSCYTIAGNLYYELGQFDKAKMFFSKMIEVADQLQLPTLAINGHLGLSKSYGRTSEFQKAYEEAQQYIAFYDSIYRTENKELINKLEFQYETEKKDKELAEQQLQLRDQENEIIQKNTQYRLALAGGGVLVITALGLFLFYRQRQRLKSREIENLHKEKEITSLESLIQGEEQERKRIAQDLHDGINGDLSVIKYKLSSIDPETLSLKARDSYNSALKMLDNSCEQIRLISHNLAPSSLQNFSLQEAIRQHCIKMSTAGKVKIDFQYFGQPLKINKETETIIYRMVQEMVNNIVKHAYATEALVQLNNHGDTLNITVEDNGTGFNSEKVNKGLGLQNIKSRVAYLNAELTFNSESTGTTYDITINLQNLPGS